MKPEWDSSDRYHLEPIIPKLLACPKDGNTPVVANVGKMFSELIKSLLSNIKSNCRQVQIKSQILTELLQVKSRVGSQVIHYEIKHVCQVRVTPQGTRVN